MRKSQRLRLFIDGQGLLMFDRQLSGVEIRGIDPTLEARVSGVDEVVQVGDLASLTDGAFNIVIGTELAGALGAGIGDKINLTLAEGIVTPAGVLPRNRRFTVSGIYRVGMYEFDRRLAFINLSDAQKLFRLGEDVSGIRLSVTDVFRAPEIVREAAISGGGGVLVSDWTRRHVNFFRSIQITKSILFVILLMVIAVAAFNIVSTLVMVVRDKQSDIAILRTFGASPAAILRVFVTQGSVIGVLGTLGGVILGVLLAVNLEGSFNSWKRVSASSSWPPTSISLATCRRNCGSGMSFGSVYRPGPGPVVHAVSAWQGARTMPAEALRYE